nr:MAG TPA: hypothetical protein [Caudoviricetes sp.]
MSEDKILCLQEDINMPYKEMFNNEFNGTENEKQICE